MILLAFAVSYRTQAETENPSLPDAPQPQISSRADATIRNVPRNILKDQEGIWTSPARIRMHDLVWLAPLAAATGVALATDRRAMRDMVSHDGTFNDTDTDLSNGLIGGFIATPVALYAIGHFGGDEHAREAGVLGAEGLLDGVVVEQGLKLVFWRERPTVDQGRGKFFQSSVGVDSSFPSSHSVLAWATAAVIADEYPHPLARLTAYSLATGVSLTRIMGQDHFPSDVMVGSAAGWLVGHYVYRHHHRRELSRR